MVQKLIFFAQGMSWDTWVNGLAREQDIKCNRAVVSDMTDSSLIREVRFRPRNPNLKYTFDKIKRLSNDDSDSGHL